MTCQTVRTNLSIVCALAVLVLALAGSVTANAQDAGAAKTAQPVWYQQASKSVYALLQRRQFTKALSESKRLLDRVSKEFGPRSFRAAITLSTRGHIESRQGKLAVALKTYKQSLGIMEELFGPSHGQVVVLMTSVASTLGQMKRIKQAETVFENALSRAASLSGKQGKDYLGVLKPYAVFNANSADKAKAEVQLNEIIVIARKVSGATSTALLDAYKQKAAYLASRKRWADLAHFEKTLIESADSEVGKLETFSIQLIANFAKIFSGLRQHKKAETLYREVVARSEARFGPAHRFTVANYTLLADKLHARGRHKGAANFYEKALQNWNAVFKKSDGNLHNIYLRYGRSLRKRGRFKESEAAFNKALVTSKKVYGKYHRYNAEPHLHLAGLYKELGRLDESEKLYKRALGASKARYGKEHSSVALTLDNMAVLYSEMGRFEDAETHGIQALEMFERLSGNRSISMVYVLNNLSHVYRSTNRSTEALRYLTRALTIVNETPRLRDHPLVGVILDNLAGIFAARGKPQKALKYRKNAYKRLVRITGKESASVATATFNLGASQADLRDYNKALDWYQKSLKLTEKLYGRNHAEYAVRLGGVGRAMKGLKNYDQALSQYRRALKIFEANLPADHPSLFNAILEVAKLLELQGRHDPAYATFQRAAKIAIGRSQQGRHLENSAAAFRGIIRTAHETSKVAGTPNSLFDASFDAAQRIGDADVASALARMSARFATGDDELGKAVRSQQDLADLLQQKEVQLTTALGATLEKRNQRLIDQLRAARDGLKRRIDSIETKLRRDFPRYAELARPVPLDLKTLRSQLKPRELYVQFTIAGSHVYAWVASKRQSNWHKLTVDRKELKQLVTMVRCGLDNVGWTDHTSGEPCQNLVAMMPEEETGLPFDLHAAHRLYRALFGAFESELKGRQLLIVAQDALATLPFHVLVREKPPWQFVAQTGEFRQVAWLAKSNAIGVLPAASSLLALRRYAGSSRAPEPFFGVGDPVLAGSAACPKIEVPKHCAADQPTEQRHQVAMGSSSTVRSGQTDLQALSQLCPLPDTAHELRCVANSLGADPKQLLLRGDANETAIKTGSEKGDLSKYRVVHFATHGLLANETQMISRKLKEPALVLTPPETATAVDDGLLTSSEIAQLKLNADWVILSACNTAGSGVPGGEALSGLARAFFYAGARSALVSHWPVNSSAAVKLTTTAFAALRAKPQLGRAEAMRRSMVAIIERGETWEAHPSFWAPFVVIGEGSGANDEATIKPTLGTRASIKPSRSRSSQRRNRQRRTTRKSKPPQKPQPQKADWAERYLQRFQ